MSKYIFVTGGVISSLGKGIVAASLGAVLEARGLSVTILKLDPYLNIDPGTMSPYQHGEVFVTKDGAETDLDLGHYERFIQSELTRANNFTSGQVYETILHKERNGDYRGATVQVIPDVTDEIKSRIKHYEGKYDIIIVEIGGTVGDIESLPFLESIRQLALDLPFQQRTLIHLTYLPYLETSGEIKTKPTQHSVKELLSIGLQANFLVCRTNNAIDFSVRDKISKFTNVRLEAVIPLPDLESIYQAPEFLHSYRLDQLIIEQFRLKVSKAADLSMWTALNAKQKNVKNVIKLAMVGKYTEFADSYKSLNEAINHSGIHLDSKVEISYIDAESIEREDASNGQGINCLSAFDCVIIPGGFGQRAIDGKIATVKYVRENNIPYLGICLGMQLAVIEYMRSVVGHSDAHSTEFNMQTDFPIIAFIEQWRDKSGCELKRDLNSQIGGTMRLGEQTCHLMPESKASRIYKSTEISERHRHRYEVNSNLLKAFDDTELKISGRSVDGLLVEMIELENHPWFVGCQFHPEFKSKPLKPHPLITNFLETALVHSQQ